MATSTGKKLDLNQLAKSIVDQAVGDAPKPPPQSEHQQAARKGGIKGGAARAATLTADQRKEIAKRAAAVRWQKK